MATALNSDVAFLISSKDTEVKERTRPDDTYSLEIIPIALVGEIKSENNSFVNDFLRKKTGRKYVSATEDKPYSYSEFPHSDTPGPSSEKYRDTETYYDQTRLEDSEKIILFMNATFKHSAGCQGLVKRLESTKNPMLIIKNFMDTDFDHENDTKREILDEKKMKKELRSDLPDVLTIEPESCRMNTEREAIKHEGSKGPMKMKGKCPDLKTSVPVVGRSGVGKSSFINAKKRPDGIYSLENISIALVGEIKSENKCFANDSLSEESSRKDIFAKEPKRCVYPEILEEYHDTETYDQPRLEDSYDKFILFTNATIKLGSGFPGFVKRLESTKNPLLLIKNFMDKDFDYENDTKVGNLDEENMKKEIHGNLPEGLTVEEGNISIISNDNLKNFDFFSVRNKPSEGFLSQTRKTSAKTQITSDPAHRSSTEKWKDGSIQDEESCRKYFNKDMNDKIERGGLGAAMRLMKEPPDIMKNVAVIGRPGVGKSSFINAIRGIKNDDPMAAKVGVVNTTKYVAAYPTKDNTNMMLWECPGFGVDVLFEKVSITKYDEFIIIECDRLTAESVKIAKKLLSTNKPFYFVRTKIDQDVRNEKLQQKYTFDEASLLMEIKADCSKNLEGVDEKDIFLISNYEPEKWGFPRLERAIQSRYCSYEPESILSYLFAFSKKQLNKKIKFLKEKFHSENRIFLLLYYIRMFLSGKSAWAYKYHIIAERLDFCRQELGFPEMDSAEFQEMPAENQGLAKKFYLNTQPNELAYVHSLLDTFDCPESKERHDFGSRVSLLNYLLDQMETTALKILIDTATQSKKSHWEFTDLGDKTI